MSRLLTKLELEQPGPGGAAGPRRPARRGGHGRRVAPGALIGVGEREALHGPFRPRLGPRLRAQRPQERPDGSPQRSRGRAGAQVTVQLGGLLRMCCTKPGGAPSLAPGSDGDRSCIRPCSGDEVGMAAPALTPTRLSRFRTGLSSGERTAIGSMAAFIVVLHVVGWGVLAGIVAPAHYVVGGERHGLRRRSRRHGVHARHAARLRRRPHRGHRQHDAQADGRRQAPGLGGLLVLPRPLLRRLRAVPAARLRRQGARRSGGERPVRAAADDRPDRDGRLRRLPRTHRRHQPRRPAADRRGVPADARGASSTRPSSRST